MMGVLRVNESQAIARSRDKLRCLQLLAREGIGLPVTGFAHSTKDIDGLIRLVGGAPLVVKLLEGTQGIGVVLAETTQGGGVGDRGVPRARREHPGAGVHQGGRRRDIRCFVVGGKVVAAMKRQARRGRVPLEPPPRRHRGEGQDHAGGALGGGPRGQDDGAEVAGVDMLRSNHGPVVMEVNSSPGLEGIEKSTGEDGGGQDHRVHREDGGEAIEIDG